MHVEFQNESAENRLALCQIIERVVRPIRTIQKKKIREELLAHLTAIYREEKEKTTDPAVALINTARRFGDPVQLSRELDAAVRRSQRFDFYFHRFFAWRPPESGTWYSFRMALLFSLIALVTFTIGLIPQFFFSDRNSLNVTLRCAAGMILALPLAQFWFLFLYFKTRDSIFGVFGSTKSPLRAALYSCLATLVFLPLAGFDALMNWSLQSVRQSSTSLVVAGLAAALILPLIARLSGPKELDETFWATLPV